MALVHFRELLTDVNTPLRLVPRPFTAAMIAIEIPAAMSPYSMAVAPVSSRQSRKTKFFIVLPSNVFAETESTPTLRLHDLSALPLDF